MKRRRKVAPLPAVQSNQATAPAPAVPGGKPIQNILQINRLRGMVRKTIGTGTAPY